MMRTLCLLSIASCVALQIQAPPKLIEKQDTCTLTYAAHSGFGNQLYAALGAGYIAKVTGCKLVLPPVLNHADIHYGAIHECTQGIRKEKNMVRQSAPWYGKSNLTWTKIFKVNQKIASEEPLKEDIRKLHFLPVHCKLWKEKGEDEAQFAQYLKDFIYKTDPKGSYTIGSGYNTGAPRLDFNELFDGLSGNLAEAVSDTQDQIAKLGKAAKGDYACVHLRSRDIYQSMHMQDKPLQEWVHDNLDHIGSKPLLVISANLKKNVQDTMKEVCSKQETECIDGSSVMPSAAYGFPEVGRQKANKQLMIELATCALAKDVYLPNSEKIINNGAVTEVKAKGAFKSTMSDLIAVLAKSKNLVLAKIQKATVAKKTNAMVYVMNQDKCECDSTQLSKSPYPVQRLKAASPSTLKQDCPAKKGVEMADKKARALKCSHYNALKQAYANSQTSKNDYSIIIEDATVVKDAAFWQQVEDYLSSPCQNWDYTAVDVTKADTPVKALSLARNLKICSWGKQSAQESTYAKVGASTHFQIVRNSAIPQMLKYMDEEEKRDRPMETIVNHFGNVVAWYPEMTVRNAQCQC